MFRHKPASRCRSSARRAGTKPHDAAEGTINRLQRLAFTLNAPAPPYQIAVTVDPTFSPAQFGGLDARQLGAQVEFRLLPARN